MLYGNAQEGDMVNIPESVFSSRLIPPFPNCSMSNTVKHDEMVTVVQSERTDRGFGVVLSFFMNATCDADVVAVSLGSAYLDLDASGVPLSAEKSWLARAFPDGTSIMALYEPLESSVVGDLHGFADEARSVSLMTLALLNCKNVHTVEKPCSPKLAKRYLERRGHKRPRYYVLDIEPMKQIIRKESGGESVTLAKVLHICRGHFKNFDDKPLFGRLKGTYWWQPHVRGTAEAGVVEKDYRIKLP
jgi:hypothetical protein